VDVPIVHFSVNWWRTLHQGATVLNANLSPTIHGAMAWTLLLGFVSFTLLFAWLLIVRVRIATLSDRFEDLELDVAIQERWGEGATHPRESERSGDSGDPGDPTATLAPTTRR
jgi:heme exporter protein C